MFVSFLNGLNIGATSLRLLHTFLFWVCFGPCDINVMIGPCLQGSAWIPMWMSLCSPEFVTAVHSKQADCACSSDKNLLFQLVVYALLAGLPKRRRQQDEWSAGTHFIKFIVKEIQRQPKVLNSLRPMTVECGLGIVHAWNARRCPSIVVWMKHGRPVQVSSCQPYFPQHRKYGDGILSTGLLD